MNTQFSRFGSVWESAAGVTMQHELASLLSINIRGKALEFHVIYFINCDPALFQDRDMGTLKKAIDKSSVAEIVCASFIPDIADQGKARLEHLFPDIAVESHYTGASPGKDRRATVQELMDDIEPEGGQFRAVVVLMNCSSYTVDQLVALMENTTQGTTILVHINEVDDDTYDPLFSNLRRLTPDQVQETMRRLTDYTVTKRQEVTDAVTEVTGNAGVIYRLSRVRVNTEIDETKELQNVELQESGR